MPCPLCRENILNLVDVEAEIQKTQPASVESFNRDEYIAKMRKGIKSNAGFV
jgi:hypothetical protein